MPWFQPDRRQSWLTISMMGLLALALSLGRLVSDYKIGLGFWHPAENLTLTLARPRGFLELPPEKLQGLPITPLVAMRGQIHDLDRGVTVFAVELPPGVSMARRWWRVSFEFLHQTLGPQAAGDLAESYDRVLLDRPAYQLEVANAAQDSFLIQRSTMMGDTLILVQYQGRLPLHEEDWIFFEGNVCSTLRARRLTH